MPHSGIEFTLIKSVVDKYFDFMIERKGNFYLTEFIPESMLGARVDEEWSLWTPLISSVTEEEISRLESLIKHQLPESFKFFLRQRHFVELMLGGYQMQFFANLPGALTITFHDKIQENYPELLERNYLPFADLSDYGVVCFDATKSCDGNEYPIVTFDHEDGYTEEQFYERDFESMFVEFNSHLDNWINDYKAKK